MSHVDKSARYLASHEWVRQGDAGAITVGISDHAQAALGDLVFIELPEVGATFDKGDAIAVVESVKAASDVYAPIGGEVIRINEALEDAPQLTNESPFEDGWLFVIVPTDTTEIDSLMDADAYAATLGD